MTARVLVVDDLELNVKVLAAKLTAEYFDVVTAMSGAEALETIERENPDIVLLDVMMPDMDGIEVCRRIRADPKMMHLPVVMITALSEPADRVRGLDAGADDILTKPVDDAAMFARVRTLVRLKSMMDELRLREETSNQLGLENDSEPLRDRDLSGALVLVIEDDVADAVIISDALSPAYTVVVEADGDRALAIARERPFDLVIVSLLHAQADGLRVCSKLRATEETRHHSLLALLAEDDTESLIKALEIGVNDYIAKPIDENELVARARTQIRRKLYQDRLRDNYRERIAMAVTDPLTGLHNRRYLLSHLANLVSRAHKGGKPVAVVMIDIDHFKMVNDSWGHMVGDTVLSERGTRIKMGIRGVDLAVRYGGEEFVVVMPDTGSDDANLVAARLTHNITEAPIPVSHEVGEVEITVSAGVAVVNGVDDTAETLLQRADDALYAAKRGGRNRVVMAG